MNADRHDTLMGTQTAKVDDHDERLRKSETNKQRSLRGRGREVKRVELARIQTGARRDACTQL